MARIAAGVIAGLVTWLIVWFGGEAMLSAISPASFGAHQRAFEAALMNGGAFTADTSLLLIQLVLGSVAAVIAGFLAALVARENRRAPLILGIVLLALGIMKAAMSWQYVPVWHHALFPALMLPMAMLGGRLRVGR